VAAISSTQDPPTAFFCLNNRITIGALRELWERRSDAGLVGFDDFELSALMPRPFLVVAYDPAELARIAAERLFARIGGDDSWPSTRTLPTYLVKRGLGPSDNVVNA
jgi:LacI family transcriptional regulator, galactose operon repressor